MGQEEEPQQAAGLMCCGQGSPWLCLSVCQPVKPLCPAAWTEQSGVSLCYSPVMVTD